MTPAHDSAAGLPDFSDFPRVESDITSQLLSTDSSLLSYDKKPSGWGGEGVFLPAFVLSSDSSHVSQDELGFVKGGKEGNAHASDAQQKLASLEDAGAGKLGDTRFYEWQRPPSPTLAQVRSMWDYEGLESLKAQCLPPSVGDEFCDHAQMIQTDRQTCVHAWLHTYVHLYVYMYMYVYTHIVVHTHTRTRTRTHMHNVSRWSSCHAQLY